ncbi:phosphatidate cytidylyltransferase [Kitasatospora indigofera]|uniref:phosphatidate cytidylyltransferase n=1 Tax=Kitasatospora indigofera TaxID=67307 RepID=UPI00369241A2
MPPVQDGSGQENPRVSPPAPYRPAGASDGPVQGPGQQQDQPQTRVPGRLSGPLFRDEQPASGVPSVEETVVLPPITGLLDGPAQPSGPRHSGPQRAAHRRPEAGQPSDGGFGASGPYAGQPQHSQQPQPHQPPHPQHPPQHAPQADPPQYQQHPQQGHPSPQQYPGQEHTAQHHPAQHHSAQHHPVPSYPGQETPVAQPDPQPRKQRGGRNLQAAIGVGVGLGAVIIASLFVVKALFLFVVMAAVVVGVWELSSRLTERKEIKAPLVPLVAGSVAMLSTGYWAGVEWAAASLALTGLAVMVWRMAAPPENYLRDVTAGIFTAFYVPFLATFVAMMLAADDGPQRIVLFLIVTVCSDTGAYAVGYKFGRTKLAPTISPGKTREGLAGGVALSMLAGALLMQLIIDDGSWWQGLILGGCAAVTATLGDLGESMIKRDLGIKDMGTLLPGHGGIMDRLDSLLPTAPVVWLLLAAFVGS